jgi:hypothetical protein
MIHNMLLVMELRKITSEIGLHWVVQIYRDYRHFMSGISFLENTTIVITIRDNPIGRVNYAIVVSPPFLVGNIHIIGNCPEFFGDQKSMEFNIRFLDHL